MGDVIPSYKDLPQFRPPSSEDYHWKLQYGKVDITTDTFEYLRNRLEALNIDQKIIDDMINYLNVLINNAAKTKIEYYQIPDLLRILRISGRVS